MWLRLELRRRWRSLAVLTLLIAVATGTVLTAVAGAKRGASAIQRMAAVCLPYDAVVLPNQPGFDWEKVRALPGVEALTQLPITGYSIEGISDDDMSQSLPMPADDQTMYTIERPVVLEGRLADPDRVGEAVVTPAFVDSYGLGVGDTVTIRLFRPETIDTGYQSATMPPADGPRVETRIVGVIRSAWYSDSVGGKGSLLPSPALFEKYRPNLLGAHEVVYLNALVRLDGGESALAAFRSDLARLTGRTDIDVWSSAEMAARFQEVDDFESACLLAFGLAALVAAVFLVGQAVARYTASTVSELLVLRELGMTPREAVRVACATPALAAAIGGGLGVAGAVVASAWMPIGSPATIEPTPGIDADWVVLAPGWAVVVLVVGGGAAAAAWRALAATRARTSSRRSVVAGVAARSGLPVPVVVGARFALEPGKGRGAVPIRPALLGAVIGVLGVVGAFTFSAGVADAADDPRRFGVTHQLQTWFGMNDTDYALADDVLSAWAGDPDVAGINDTRSAVAESGRGQITLISYDPVGQPIDVVLTEGRLPTGADEVVLGPHTAALVGARVGDSIDLGGTSGDVRSMTVTGIGFVIQGSHNDYSEGGWVTTAGYRALFGDGFKNHEAMVALRPGADPAAVARPLTELAAAATGGEGGVEILPAPTPEQVAQIEDVRILPVVLGGFLVLLAVAAVGHALATAVRRRRHDVAVLRALGLTRRQSWGIVATQATVLAGFGLIFGIPLGVALGRTLWRVVADLTPLYYQPPAALLAILLVVPLAILVANTLAAWPGRRAARLRVSHILRAE